MAKTITIHGKYKGVIVSKTNILKIKKTLKDKYNEIAERIAYRMEMIGEAAVKIAREKGKANDYHDVTGNLRSSIGYVILIDGNVYKQGKPEQFGGSQGNGSQGVAAAQRLLQSLQTKFPWGVVLIVCAGMKYAAYVESVKHKDVLTSAELRAEELANKLLKSYID